MPPPQKGLKNQHVAAIQWLAAATDAQVTGLAVGSHTLEFRPRRKPSDLARRRIAIEPASPAASTLLVFQAIFPFLLFAGGDAGGGGPIELELSGGTNVAFSPTYEYLDQVLLPALEERFGVVVERTRTGRGWSLGALSRGTISLKFTPLAPGTTLKPRERPALRPSDFEVKTVDVSVVAPSDMHESLSRALVRDLGSLFPDADVEFKPMEDSGRDSRVYVLLVARSAALRWGRDILTSVPKKAKSKSAVSDAFSRQVAKDLYREVRKRGVVDEFLQDQLVVFQALAEGRTSFPRSEGEDTDETDAADALAGLQIGEGDEGLKKVKKIYEPFGEGTTHTTTARWVTAELLPGVTWYNNGSVCDGAGIRMPLSWEPDTETSTGA